MCKWKIIHRKYNAITTYVTILKKIPLIFFLYIYYFNLYVKFLHKRNHNSIEKDTHTRIKTSKTEKYFFFWVIIKYNKYFIIYFKTTIKYEFSSLHTHTYTYTAKYFVLCLWYWCPPNFMLFFFLSPFSNVPTRYGLHVYALNLHKQSVSRSLSI